MATVRRRGRRNVPGHRRAFDTNGRRVAERFIRTVGSPQVYSATTIDTPCKPLVMELMAGHPGLVPLLDWQRARFALLLGTNPVVSHGHSNPVPGPRDPPAGDHPPGRAVGRRSTSHRDGPVGVAPPRPPAGHRPHPARPSGQGLLRSGADRSLPGRPRQRRRRLGGGRGPLRPGNVTAARCGLPESDLTELLATIRRYGSASAQTGTGITMSAAANVTEWLVWALNIVTHSYDRPGAMWFNPGYLRRLDTRTWAPGGGRPGPGPASRPDLPGRFGEFPCAALADEIEAGNLRALFVVGGNPVTSFPDAARTAAALGRASTCSPSATSSIPRRPALATHVLACADQLERADLPQYIDAHLPMVATQYTAGSGAARRRPATAVVALRPAGRPPRARPAAGPGSRHLLGRRSAGGRGLPGPVAPSSISGRPAGRWSPRTPPSAGSTELLPDGRWRLAPAPLVAQLARLRRSTRHGARPPAPAPPSSTRQSGRRRLAGRDGGPAVRAAAPGRRRRCRCPRRGTCPGHAARRDR